MPDGNYTTVIPSLTINNPLIRDKSSKIAYIIRHAMNSPGWTSSLIESELVSARKSDAMHGSDPSAVANALERDLRNAIRAHYTDCSVGVKLEWVKEATYKFVISVTDSTSGQNLIYLESVRNENGEFNLTETALEPQEI